MRKTLYAKTTPSMMRSKVKKERKGKLPSSPVLDPFLMKFVRYNRNGRMLVLESTGWKEVET